MRHDYIKSPRTSAIAPAPEQAKGRASYKNSFEKEVASYLRDAGYHVNAGVEIGGVNEDLVVNNKFVIECDGLEDNIKSNISNMKKQAIIERCGLLVCRFSLREWKMSKDACLNRMINYL